jgi:hypothetical protein
MSPVPFKQIVYSVSQSVQAEVLSIHEPSVTPNFFAAELVLSGEKIYLLCSISGLWAFSARFNPADCQLRFIDSQKLAAALSDLFGIVPISAEALNGPMKILPEMSEADLRYWKPKSFGEGVFHWWD